jgi:hypothetical protein
MRRLAPRTRERSQQLLSGLCYTRPPYWAHPAKCRTRSSRASLARRLDEHQRLTFSRPNTPSTSIDDSAPLARTARRKACADAVSRHRAGGRIPSGGSLSNKGLLHCVHAFYRRKCTTYHPPTTPSSANAKWRTSQPSACNGSRSQNEPHVRLLLCMSRLAAECHETAQSGRVLVRGH